MTAHFSSVVRPMTVAKALLAVRPSCHAIGLRICRWRFPATNDNLSSYFQRLHPSHCNRSSSKWEKIQSSEPKHAHLLALFPIATYFLDSAVSPSVLESTSGYSSSKKKKRFWKSPSHLAAQTSLFPETSAGLTVRRAWTIRRWS
jgi:hypothetical protein